MAVIVDGTTMSPQDVQVWNLTTAFQGAGSPNYGKIIANWSSSAPSNAVGTPLVGTAPVTQSSGVFTFASTGFYLINLLVLLQIIVEQIKIYLQLSI